MPRAPYQILVLPYRRLSDGPVYALLQRADDGCWQGIAGGGEDDELPLAAARRESREEAALPDNCPLLALQAVSSVPVCHFSARSLWPHGLYVIPEYCFGLDAGSHTIILSREHRSCAWLAYDKAYERLRYDSNRVALWELNQRLLEAYPRA